MTVIFLSLISGTIHRCVEIRDGTALVNKSNHVPIEQQLLFDETPCWGIPLGSHSFLRYSKSPSRRCWPGTGNTRIITVSLVRSEDDRRWLRIICRNPAPTRTTRWQWEVCRSIAEKGAVSMAESFFACRKPPAVRSNRFTPDNPPVIWEENTPCSLKTAAIHHLHNRNDSRVHWVSCSSSTARGDVLDLNFDG